MSGQGVKSKRILKTRPCMEPFIKHVSLKQRQGKTEVHKERTKQEADKDRVSYHRMSILKLEKGEIYL